VRSQLSERKLANSSDRPIVVTAKISAQQWNGADDVSAWNCQLEPVTRAVVKMKRLLDEQHRRCACKTRKKLLRTLPHEIPSKVTLDDQRVFATLRLVALIDFQIVGHVLRGESYALSANTISQSACPARSDALAPIYVSANRHRNYVR
jgi:hypothetical protein